MKTHQLIRIGSLCLILATISCYGCKKDEVDVDPIQSQPETSITFKVLDDSISLANVLIGITPNSTDRNNGNFVYTGTTGATGKYKFGPLMPDMYFYAATWNNNGTSYKRTGSVGVAELESKLDTIVF